MGAWQAQLRLNQGRWAEAEEIVTHLLQAPDLDNPSYAYSRGLLTLGRLLVRRGGEGGTRKLDEMLSLMGQSDALARRGTTAAARAEAAWLAGDREKSAQEAQAEYSLALAKGHPWIAGELAFWIWRAGGPVEPQEWIAEPFALQVAGDWLRAAQEWERRGCPYEQGMALMDGDEEAQLQALQIFERLGARPIIEKLKQQMRLQGVRGIPRGPRPSTRENAFGLTGRELEVLSHLAKGSSNNAIAKTLSLSTRTVEHHIAAVLRKTGTRSRSEVVALALKDSLFPPD